MLFYISGHLQELSDQLEQSPGAYLDHVHTNKMEFNFLFLPVFRSQKRNVWTRRFLDEGSEPWRPHHRYVI
jgi:hypothetical protein